jgi:hypothetical protein
VAPIADTGKSELDFPSFPSRRLLLRSSFSLLGILPSGREGIGMLFAEDVCASLGTDAGAAPNEKVGLSAAGAGSEPGAAPKLMEGIFVESFEPEEKEKVGLLDSFLLPVG